MNKIDILTTTEGIVKIKEGQVYVFCNSIYFITKFENKETKPEFALVNLSSGLTWHSLRKAEEIIETLNKEDATLVTKPFTVTPGD